MPVRETLERGTIKSRRSPISHSDLSISRPAPLISVLSSTTVLQVISKIHTSKYRIVWPQKIDRNPRVLYLQTYVLENWDRIRLSRTLQCQTSDFRDLECTAFIDSRELGLCEADRFYKLNLQSRVRPILLIIYHQYQY